MFTDIDRAHRKFSDEQIKNFGVITRLYNGDTEAFADLVNDTRLNWQMLPKRLRIRKQRPKRTVSRKLTGCLEDSPMVNIVTLLVFAKLHPLKAKMASKTKTILLMPVDMSV